MKRDKRITRSDVRVLIAWARLKPDSDRIEMLVKALPSHLTYAERLSKVDVTGVEPAFVDRPIEGTSK